jgi:hypothetical protein
MIRKIFTLLQELHQSMTEQDQNPTKKPRLHPCHELLELSDNSSESSQNLSENEQDGDDDDDEEEEITEFEEEEPQRAEWGICISHENTECMICFEKTVVFSPSCCDEKQNICVECIWNVIKEKIPKTTNITKKSIEKNILNDFSCCFCRKLTRLSIHVPSVYPQVFKNLCKKVLKKNPRKTPNRPIKFKIPSNRPRGRPPKNKY